MDLAQKSDTEIFAVASPIMDNLMDASTAIDYERHTRDFTERAKSVLSKDALQRFADNTKAATPTLNRSEHP